MPNFDISNDREVQGSGINSIKDLYGVAPLNRIETYDGDNLSIIQITERVSPVVIGRIIKQAIDNIEDSEGEIIPHRGPSIKWDEGPAGIKMEMGLHESHIEDEFIFRSNYNKESPRPPTTSTPTDLGGEAKEFGSYLGKVFNIEWEFAELKAASIGYGGHLVDFEFTYEGITSASSVKQAKIE